VAEKYKLPKLIELQDMKGDLQMHTTASDGKNTIEEMAAAGAGSWGTSTSRLRTTRKR